MICEICQVLQSRRGHNFGHYRCPFHLFFLESLVGKERMDPISRVALSVAAGWKEKNRLSFPRGQIKEVEESLKDHFASLRI